MKGPAGQGSHQNSELPTRQIFKYIGYYFIPITKEHLIKIIGSIASYLAIVVWGAMLALVAKCAGIPPLHIVGLAGVTVGLAQAVKEASAGGMKALKAPAGACLFEALGVTGYRVLIYPAIFMIDPVDAANLANLWIPVVIVCSLLLTGKGLATRHWIGILCAGAAMAVALVGGIGVGHVMALCAGLALVWYLIKYPHVEGRGDKASAIGNMAAGGFVILLALIAGNPLAIEGGDWFWFAGLLVASAVNVMLWQYGAKHGDLRAAKVGVLFLPLAAVLWIWILGVAPPNPADVFATLAVTAAGLLLSPHVLREARTARP